MSGDDRGNLDETRSDSRERLMRGRQRPVEVDDEDEFLANSGDLRYEGPITFEDEEDGELHGDGGGGKVFLTATLIGAAVILLIGVALWLRRDGDTSASSTLSAQVRPAPATTDAPRVSQSPAETDRATLPPGVASPLDAATRPAAATTEPAATPLAEPPPAAAKLAESKPAESKPAEPRPADVPLQSASGTAGPGATTREPAPARTALVEPPVERPAPRAASTTLEERAPEPVREPVKKAAAKPAVEEHAPAKTAKAAKTPKADAEPEPQPAPSTSSTSSTSSTNVHALVAAGKLKAAAQAGLQRAHAEKGYTLQLLYACSPETVTRAFHAVGDDKLFLVPAANSKKSCYRLMWGRFPSHDGAAAAVGSVPDYFRQHKADKPIPVALDKIAGS